MTTEKEYTTKEFWDKAPEGYDYWIVGIGDCSTIEPSFHYLYEDKDFGWMYKDSEDEWWPKDAGEGFNYLLYKRPEHFEEDNMNTAEDTFLKTGLICEALWNSIKTEYKKIKVIGFDGELCVYVWLEGELQGQYEATWPTAVDSKAFREIPKEISQQEKLLDAWKKRSLDYAHDNLKSSATLEEVFDFIVVNYNLEEISSD